MPNPTDDPVLELTDVRKGFADPLGGRREVIAARSISIGRGEQVAVAGRSGAGKTTLLHLIAGLLRADQGSVRVCGRDVGAMSESARDAFRARHVGYVLQSFHLLPAFTALENVQLAMAFAGSVDEARATTLLTQLGLGDRLHDRPRALSIGQQQRVAVARALAPRPALVLADEPTGNLDPESAAVALRMLRDGCAAEGAALLLVSHDPAVIASFDHVVDVAEWSASAASAASNAADGEEA